jgi:hypothetical protein
VATHFGSFAAATRPKGRSRRSSDVLIFCRQATRRFLLLDAWKRGVRDGRPGFDYSVLMAFYDYLIKLTVRESRQHQGRNS